MSESPQTTPVADDKDTPGFEKPSGIHLSDADRLQRELCIAPKCTARVLLRFKAFNLSSNRSCSAKSG